MIEQNFLALLEDSIRKNWEVNALSDYKGTGLCYSEIAEKIIRIHYGFREVGIVKGDKISLIGKNSVNWAVTYLAIISYGAVVVPILPDFVPDDVHHIVNHSDSVILFSSDSILETLDKAKMEGLRGIFSLTDFSIVWSKEGKIIEEVQRIDAIYKAKFPNGIQKEDVRFPENSNMDLAVINYTSGTTGFSKGVMINYNSLMANILYAQRNMPLKAGDSIVSFLPLAHTYGCAFEFLFPFSLGCHITFLTKSPSPQIIVEAFQQIKPRLILCVPLVIEKVYKKQILPKISKQPLKALLHVPLINLLLYKKIKSGLVNAFGGNFHEVVIGGAAFNREVEIFLTKIKFPFSTGYGMTECSPLISYRAWNQRKMFSAGRMIDYLEVKIDSSDPMHEVGEIMVKGENIMIGYYKNEEATKSVLDENGWLHTGDLGVIDAENNIYIRGRSKDMILGPSGQNIYPEEIEAKLNNKELVQDCIVIEKGGKLVALVCPDFEIMQRKGLTLDDLTPIMEEYRKEINAKVPAFMNVSRMEIYKEEFSMTPKKSIKRYLYV
jgi:long-chain acyl-CoA synthetase